MLQTIRTQLLDPSNGILWESCYHFFSAQFAWASKTSFQDCHPAAAAGTRCVLRRALLLLALMSVQRSNSVSLIRLLVTKVNHRTQAYLGPGLYNATARNNAIWSLGMNTCCLHVLVWCRSLFHGFERVQPRPGALDFARDAHFFCSALVTFLRVQPGLLPLVGAALGWKPCFFFSAWLVPYLRCKWLPKPTYHSKFPIYWRGGR